jgi:Replication initiation factor
VVLRPLAYTRGSTMYETNVQLSLEINNSANAEGWGLCASPLRLGTGHAIGGDCNTPPGLTNSIHWIHKPSDIACDWLTITDDVTMLAAYRGLLTAHLGPHGPIESSFQGKTSKHVGLSYEIGVNFAQRELAETGEYLRYPTGRIRVDIQGSALRSLTGKQFLLFLRALASLHSPSTTCTRFDIAVNHYDAQYTLSHIEHLHIRPDGTKLYPVLVDGVKSCTVHANDKGRTLVFGSYGQPMLLRIYDKNNFPRHELQLRTRKANYVFRKLVAIVQQGHDLPNTTGFTALHHIEALAQVLKCMTTVISGAVRFIHPDSVHETHRERRVLQEWFVDLYRTERFAVIPWPPQEKLLQNTIGKLRQNLEHQFGPSLHVLKTLNPYEFNALMNAIANRGSKRIRGKHISLISGIGQSRLSDRISLRSYQHPPDSHLPALYPVVDGQSVSWYDAIGKKKQVDTVPYCPIDNPIEYCYSLEVPIG